MLPGSGMIGWGITPAFYRQRSLKRWILPVAVFGNSLIYPPYISVMS
jgi:hypothetical protein